MEQKDSRFAVLIDADNVSPKYIKYILDEVSDQGVATYKRIYGDWTDISKKSWKEQLLRYSIKPIQQYSNTNGKNSTDSAMIIDAMDILYSGNVEGLPGLLGFRLYEACTAAARIWNVRARYG